MAADEIILRPRIDLGTAVREFNQFYSSVESRSEQAASQIQKNFSDKKIEQVVAVRWQIDENGLKRPIASIKEIGGLIDQVDKKTERLNQTLPGSVTSLRQSVNQAKQLRDGMVKVGMSVDDYGNKIKGLNPAWELANQKVRELGRQLEIASASGFWERLKAEFNLGPILNGGKAINELVNTFQSLSIVVGQVTAPVKALLGALNDIQQINLLFKGIGAGPADVSKVFADSARIALDYGVNLKTVREGFSQLTPVIMASGGGLDNVSEIMGALSSRFVTFGMSAEKSRRVMNGVIQAFGKGKLMAEELTQQISEADPAFKTDLAAAIGVTVAQLTEMVKAGEITSDKLIEFLPLLGKNSSMFGKLGTSATSAVAALARGQATIEQVENQLATLSQLNLESLGKLFEPLLGSFLQVGAAVVDFSTNLMKLDLFKTIAQTVNSLGVQLAGLFTAFTNLIIVILKVVDPIFAAITAIDDFSQQIGGFRIVTTALAALITGKLIVSLYSLAATAIPTVVTAMNGLSASFITVNRAGIVQFITSIGNVIKELVLYVPKTVAAIASNIALARSYGSVATAAGAAATAQGIQAGASGAASVAAAALIKQGKGVEAAMSGIDAASGVASKGLGGFGRFAGVAAVAMLPVVYALELYKGATSQATDSSKSYEDGLKSLRDEYARFKGASDEAVTETEKFEQKLEELKAKTRDRNDFDIAIDVIFQTDLNSAVSILATKAAMNKKFKELETSTNSARNALASFDSAQDASGAASEELRRKLQLQVDSYSLLIQKAREAADKLAAKGAETGQALDPKEVIALKAFNKDIEKFTAARDKLIADSKAKGIVVKVDVDAKELDETGATIGGIKEKIKALQDQQTSLRFGTVGLTEAIQQTKGYESLLKILESDPVEIKIKARFELDKAEIESQLQLGEALVSNTQARAGLESSILDVYKSRASFAVSSAETELDAMRKRGASAADIKTKENEIAQLKQNERNVEKAAIIQKLQTIGAVQKQEIAILDLKQVQQRIEAQQVVEAARRNVLEAQIAEQVAKQNYFKAMQNGASSEELKSLREIWNLSSQSVDSAKMGVQAAITRKNTLDEVQKIERDTLGLQQASARNQLNAQAAAQGIGSSISYAGQAMGDLNRQSAGFIEVGDKVVQVYKEASTTIGGMTVPIENATSSVATMGQAAAGTNSTLAQVRNALSASGTEAGTLSDNINQVTDYTARLQEAAVVAAQAFGGANDAATGLLGTTEGINEQIESGDPKAYSEAMGAAAEGASEITGSGFSDATAAASTSASALGDSMFYSAGQAEQLYNTLSSIDGLNPVVTVSVIGGTQGRWAGGPTKAGETYRVNELGKEAFLSASGRLSMINRPKNGFWKAPSSGTVIPAHLTSRLDIPSGGVNLASGASARVSRAVAGASGSAGIGRAIAAALQASGIASTSQSVATTQASQALQIGKLTHAVNKLVDKDWNVHVNVKDQNSASYIDFMNRMS